MLLFLLLVWAALMFLLFDLFLNVEQFDRIRPESQLYEGMRFAAHEMVGEPYYDDMASPGTVSVAGRTVSRDASVPRPEHLQRKTVCQSPRLRTRLPKTADRAYLKHKTYAQWNLPGGKPGQGEYKDRQRDGVWFWHWSEGVVRERRTYKKGVLHGQLACWYENGERESEENYENGKPQGLWRVWHDNGQLAAVETYHAGVLHGDAERWYSDGQVAAQANYDEGQPRGAWRRWHPNGKLAEQGQFAEGKQDGVWTTWDETGAVVREERFEKGRKLK
jgi:hypothetical protein